MSYFTLLFVGYLVGSYVHVSDSHVPQLLSLSSRTTSYLRLHPIPTTKPVNNGHNRRATLHQKTQPYDSTKPSTETDTAAVSPVASVSHAAVKDATAAAALPPANRTLRFEVCNGFANQRLGLMYGMLLARHLNRAAVMPMLVANGMQRSDANVMASADNQVPFSDMYDQPGFIRAMAAVGVRVLPNEDAPPPSAYTQVPLAPLGWSVVGPLAAHYGGVAHLAVDCVLFKLGKWDMTVGDEDLAWSVLEGLQPNKEAAALVDKVVRSVAAVQVPNRATGQGGASLQSGFNFLHLRVENDWVQHCARWQALNDGVVRDNCYNYTDEIGTRLALFGLSNRTALYVASYWEDVDPARKAKAMSQLAAAGYKVVTSADVYPQALRNQGKVQGQGAGTSALSREYRALFEYFIAMRANRFIGNSVSTFAALALLERRHKDAWGAYYNGGNIPLTSLIPLLHRLPWVFTYNSWSRSYEYMLKGAVRSAMATRSLKPYCIFGGNASSPIALWLVEQGVTMISHTPAWRDRLLQRARAKAKENVHHSHLFKTPDMLVSTFQRVDLPVVPVLDQYTYVLYTDADVFFRRPVHLDDFGLPLPRTISMSYEFVNMFPYNAGVLVANLPAMRLRYNDFIRTMLENDNGLYYPNYGPADQGILNKFYEADLKAQMLSQAFNAKPYNAFDPAAFIAHFHGPKPHDLLSFLLTGQCDFYTVCESSFLNAVCQYGKEWVQWVGDQVEGVSLEDACAWLETPNVLEVFKKRWGLVPPPPPIAASPPPPTTNGTLAVAQIDQIRAAHEDTTFEQHTATAVGQREQRFRRALQQRQKELEQEPQEPQKQVAQQGQGADQAAAQQRGQIPQGGQSQQTQGQQEQKGQGQLGQGQPEGGAGAQPPLLAFDTAQVVAADEAAVDVAWGIHGEGEVSAAAHQ